MRDFRETEQNEKDRPAFICCLRSTCRNKALNLEQSRSACCGDWEDGRFSQEVAPDDHLRHAALSTFSAGELVCVDSRGVAAPRLSAVCLAKASIKADQTRTSIASMALVWRFMTAVILLLPVSASATRSPLSKERKRFAKQRQQN